jgi:hypothetical protein
MVTGYEVKAYNDLGRIANALEGCKVSLAVIADELVKAGENATRPIDVDDALAREELGDS